MNFQQSDSKEVRISRQQSRLTGQKTPLRLREIWEIRIRLQLTNNIRDLALFNLAIDSKLRACDLLRLKVSDATNGSHLLNRSSVIQKKTGKPVKFEITQMTRESLKALIEADSLREDDYLFQSRLHDSPHLSRRQYARIVKSWITMIGLDPTAYGTHSMRRTKPTLIYRRTKNLRAVQLLLGHTKLDSTVRYLGIELDDALEMAEQTEV